MFLLFTRFHHWLHCFIIGYTVSSLVTLFHHWLHYFIIGYIVSSLVTLFHHWLHCFIIGYIVSSLVTLFHHWLHYFIIGYTVSLSLAVIAGFTQGKRENFTPFVPFGWRNIFNGAAQLFFSYIGFDAVATTAEEVRAPPLAHLIFLWCSRHHSSGGEGSPRQHVLG